MVSICGGYQESGRFKIKENTLNYTLKRDLPWPRGLMAKALDSEFIDCGFKSHRVRTFR